jgi:cell division protein FtsN
MAYEFSLDRKATVTLSASSLVLIILVFVAGILTGVTWQSNQDLVAFQKLPRRAPKASAVMQPPAFTQEAAATPSTPAAAVAATPAFALTPAASPGAPQPPAAEPAATASSAAASRSPQVAPQVAASDTVTVVPDLQLAVQVGAFLERANADKLAAQLKEEGYSPQIVQDGHAPKQWNFVRVGPYHDWDEAAEIASVLSRDLPSPAVVRPMR